MVIIWAYIICNFLDSIKDNILKQKLQHYCWVNKVYWYNTYDNTEDERRKWKHITGYNTVLGK